MIMKFDKQPTNNEDHKCSMYIGCKAATTQYDEMGYTDISAGINYFGY